MNYSEAFKKLNLLDENIFEISKQGIEDLSAFKSKDNDADNIVNIIDSEADCEDCLKNSYIGKVICECPVCGSLIYKNSQDITYDKNEELINTDEECPYCYNIGGYKIIGEVAEREPEHDLIVNISNEEDDDLTFSDSLHKDGDITNDSDKGELDKKSSFSNDFDKEELDKELSFISFTPEEIDKIVSADSDKKEEEKLKEIEETGTVSESFEQDNDDAINEGGKGSGRQATKAYDMDGYLGTTDHVAYRTSKIRMPDKHTAGRRYDRPKHPLSVYSYMQAINAEDRPGTDFYIIDDKHNELIGQIDDYSEPAYYKKGESEDSIIKHDFEDALRSLIVSRIEADGRKLFFYVDASPLGKYEDENGYHKYDIGNFNIDELPNKKENESIKKSIMKSVVHEGLESASIDLDDSDLNISVKDSAFTGAKVKMDDGRVVDVSVEDKIQEGEEEIIAPLSDETKIEIIDRNEDDGEDELLDDEKLDDMEIKKENSFEKNEELEDDDSIDIYFDDINEESMSRLGESYLKKVYDNVKSFNLTDAFINQNSIILEGIIGFNSGANKITRFKFSPVSATNNNTVSFIGENTEITRGKKSFKLKGIVENGSLICESLRYNYTQKDDNNKSVRVHGIAK